METRIIDNRTWFCFKQEEITDIVYSLICNKSSAELHLRDDAQYLTIKRQMEIRRNINSYCGLIEQLSRGVGYDNK